MIWGWNLQWRKVCNGFSAPLQIFRGMSAMGGGGCYITPETWSFSCKKHTSSCGICVFDYAPFEKGGAYCVAHVGLSVGMSVSLNLVQLITQERFDPEASNLVGR